MDDDGLLQLTKLFNMGSENRLNDFPLHEFDELVKKDDHFSYEMVYKHIPNFTVLRVVTIRNKVLYSYSELKEDKQNGNGTIVIYKTFEGLRAYFVDYETMMETAWQPPNDKMKVVMPSLYGEFYK